MNKWIEKRLTDIVEFSGGSQPPKSFFSDKEEDGYVRLIQIRDYKSDNHKVFVPKDKTKKFCTKDDIMIGRYGPPVFQILKGLEGAYNVALMKAIPNEEIITKEFLFKFLCSPDIQNYIVGLSQRSAGQSGVNKKALEEYPILIPTIDEQQQIVAKLDLLFERIDKSIALLEVNIQHTKDLMVSVLNEEFNGKTSDWKEYKLSDILKLYNGRAYKRHELLEQGKYKVIRIQNLNGGDNFYYSDMELDEFKYCENGQLLYSWSGTPGTSFGAFIWNGDKSIYHYHIWRVDIIGNNNRDFLFYTLKHLTNKVIDKARGVTGMMHTTKGEMENMKIRIPSLNEQKAIAAKLIKIENNSRGLLKQQNEKLNHLKALKCSLLDKAFKGELI